MEKENQEDDIVTYGLTKFPMVLREHYDSEIPIKNQ